MHFNVDDSLQIDNDNFDSQSALLPNVDSNELTYLNVQRVNLSDTDIQMEDEVSKDFVD